MPRWKSKDDGDNDAVLNAVPPPLPPVYDPTVEQEQLKTVAEHRQRLARLKISPALSTSEDPDEPNGDVEDAIKTSEIWVPSPYIPASNSPTARTPTPTFADFRSMLESYDEIPSAAIPQLLHLASRLTEVRVQAARIAEQASWNAKESPPSPEPEIAEVMVAKQDLKRLLDSFAGMPVEEAQRLVEMAERVGDPRVRVAREEEREKQREAFIRRTSTPEPVFEGKEKAPEVVAEIVAAVTDKIDGAVRTVSRAQDMSLRVMVRLLPAKLILEEGLAGGMLPSVQQARRAARYACRALALARELGAAVVLAAVVLAAVESGQDDWSNSPTGEKQEVGEIYSREARMSRALQGRCAFYAALANWIIALSHVENGEDGDDSESRPVSVLQYFELAQQAAEENFLESTLR